MTNHVDKILDVALVRSPIAAPCAEVKQEAEPELPDVIPDAGSHLSAEIRQ